MGSESLDEGPAIPDSLPFRRYVALIGAPKCGTTSLANWLNCSPDFVLAENKEPGLFRSPGGPLWVDSRRRRKHSWTGAQRDAFWKAFPNVPEGAWALDASTDHLSDERAVDGLAKLAQRVPVKILCIVRDPVERAFSEYKHTIRSGIEHLSFRGSLKAEAARMQAGFQPLFFHRRRSQFHADICRYRHSFGRDMLVLPYGAIRSAETLIEQICHFVGVPPFSLEQFTSKNVSASPPPRYPDMIRRNPLLRRLRSTSVGRALERGAAYALTARSKARMDLRDADARFLAEQLRHDIEACVADPQIPTDDWWSPALLSGREALGRWGAGLGRALRACRGRGAHGGARRIRRRSRPRRLSSGHGAPGGGYRSVGHPVPWKCPAPVPVGPGAGPRGPGAVHVGPGAGHVGPRRGSVGPRRGSRRFGTMRAVSWSMDIVRILLAVLLPPVGVGLQVGLGGHFWLNILLTLLGYFPGLVHAIYIIGRRR